VLISCRTHNLGTGHGPASDMKFTSSRMPIPSRHSILPILQEACPAVQVHTQPNQEAAQARDDCAPEAYVVMLLMNVAGRYVADQVEGIGQQQCCQPHLHM
jgi:hypothetical protein